MCLGFIDAPGFWQLRMETPGFRQLRMEALELVLYARILDSLGVEHVEIVPSQRYWWRLYILPFSCLHDLHRIKEMLDRISLEPMPHLERFCVPLNHFLGLAAAICLAQLQYIY